MKITIEIEEPELEVKKAIAKGWNERYGDKLTHKDISEVSNKDDILRGIFFLDWDKMEVEVEK